MYSHAFSFLFVAFLALTLVVRFWLASRHIRHVMQNRAAVPADFAEKISLTDHQKAADYTVARTKLGLLNMMVSSIALICFTLLGGLQWLSATVFNATGGGMKYQLGLIVVFMLISSAIEVPLDYYRKFHLEERFGFNKMGRGLFFRDLLVDTGVSFAFGLPLIWVILYLMGRMGEYWWLYAWATWCVFQLSMVFIHPNVIAPLYNKFTPLGEGELKTRIENLLRRVGFISKGLFVMDESKRSAHGNAYFWGFGAAKRIVLFDTLVSALDPHEAEAVMAHELGHFKLKHTAKRIVIIFSMMLPILALLGYLKGQLWFYTGLGVNPIIVPGQANDALALLLFMLVLPVFTFLLAPLMSISSRKHEYEADAFAAEHTNARDMISALVKMFKDNATTLTPDPLHSAFYDSHPPASLRIRQLNLAASK